VRKLSICEKVFLLTLTRRKMANWIDPFLKATGNYFFMFHLLPFHLIPFHPPGANVIKLFKAVIQENL